MSTVKDLLNLLVDSGKQHSLGGDESRIIDAAIEQVLLERMILENARSDREGADRALSAILHHSVGDRTFAQAVINMEHNLRNSRVSANNWRERYEHERYKRMDVERRFDELVARGYNAANPHRSDA